MSAATLPLPPQVTYTSEPIYRLTVDQYHDLIERAILTSDDPVELIEGVLVFKMPKNEARIAAIRRCRRAVEAVIPPACFYDSEQPITLSDGEPEPDGMLVHGKIEDFDLVRVLPNDVLLVIEIADSTLARDRGLKLRSYARAGMICYWIVNLIDRQIEVFTDPDATTAIPRFQRAEIFRSGDAVPLRIDGVLAGQINVSEVLPPVE